MTDQQRRVVVTPCREGHGGGGTPIKKGQWDVACIDRDSQFVFTLQLLSCCTNTLIRNASGQRGEFVCESQRVGAPARDKEKGRMGC